MRVTASNVTETCVMERMKKEDSVWQRRRNDAIDRGWDVQEYWNIGYHMHNKKPSKFNKYSTYSLNHMLKSGNMIKNYWFVNI